jgi:hypothetical protein
LTTGQLEGLGHLKNPVASSGIDLKNSVVSSGIESALKYMVHVIA